MQYGRIKPRFMEWGVLSLIALLLVAKAVPVDHALWKKRRQTDGEIVPLRHVLQNDGVKVICVYVATRGFWRQGFNTFYPLFAVMTVGLGEASVGLALSVYMLGGGLLQIPFGFLADRFSRFPQIILGSTLAPLLLLAIPFIHQLWFVTAVMFGISTLSALSRASILAIRTEFGRTHGMGTLAGLQGATFAAGQMIGPPTSGLIADVAGV